MIKEALIKKFEGDIAVAKADLKTFLAQPMGVAEHIDYVATAEKKLEALFFHLIQILKKTILLSLVRKFLEKFH